jgi:hypothetical protein
MTQSQLSLQIKSKRKELKAAQSLAKIARRKGLTSTYKQARTKIKALNAQIGYLQKVLTRLKQQGLAAQFEQFQPSEPSFVPSTATVVAPSVVASSVTASSVPAAVEAAAMEIDASAPVVSEAIPEDELAISDEELLLLDEDLDLDEGFDLASFMEENKIAVYAGLGVAAYFLFFKKKARKVRNNRRRRGPHRNRRKARKNRR